MSEQVVTSLVSAKEARAHVEHITTAIPSRLAGSENARRMAEYSAAALDKAGVAATIFEMPGLVSFPDKAELRVLAPKEFAIDANTLGNMEEAIREALLRWEPRIDVTDVKFDASEAVNGLLTINIEYKVRATNTDRNLVYPFYVIPAEEME